jgi:glycosyltransferase involved in cell wall biosynthesis
LKLMYLNYEYPPVGGGGGATTQAIAEAVARRGHQVYVITGGIHGHLGIERPMDTLTVERVNTYRRRPDTCAKSEMLTYLLFASYLLPKRARRMSYDLIHVFFGFPTGGAVWVNRPILRQPYVVSLLGGDVPGFLPRETGIYHRILMPFTRALWRNAAAVVPDSSSLGALARKSLERDYPVITNGVDLRTFRPEGRTEECGVVRLLFAGRLVPQKGLDVLLKALGRVAPQLPPWRLTILGDGPHAASYKDLCHSLGLESRTEWRGWIPFSQLPHEYRSHDILVLPSRFEGMASVVLQAMARGCPMISSRVFSAEELVKDGENGYLFEVENDEQLGDRIVRACSPRRLVSMRTHAIRKASDYSWERVSAEYIDLYYRSLGMEP